MGERSVHKGPCRDCGRPMVDQREWSRNPRIRQGRVKQGGLGHCQACYMRGRRHGTLPKAPKVSVIATRYVVSCDQCGPVGEVGDREQADQMQAEHRAEHGVAPASPPLGDLELARLRRAVGLAS